MFINKIRPEELNFSLSLFLFIFFTFCVQHTKGLLDHSHHITSIHRTLVVVVVVVALNWLNEWTAINISITWFIWFCQCLMIVFLFLLQWVFNVRCLQQMGEQGKHIWNTWKLQKPKKIGNEKFCSLIKFCVFRRCYVMF